MSQAAEQFQLDTAQTSGSRVPYWPTERAPRKRAMFLVLPADGQLDEGQVMDPMFQIREHIQRLYDLQDRPAIWQFLSGQHQVSQDLVDVHTYIVQHFGPEPQVTLRVITDPEYPDWTQLFGFIHTTQSFDSALDTLDAMRLQWFRDRPNRDRHALTLTVECE